MENWDVSPDRVDMYSELMVAYPVGDVIITSKCKLNNDNGLLIGNFPPPHDCCHWFPTLDIKTHTKVENVDIPQEPFHWDYNIILEPPTYSNHIIESEILCHYIDAVANVDIWSEEPLIFERIHPGSQIMATIFVQNSGDNGSQLDWEICEYPDWGEWDFDPSEGEGLKPSDGPYPINITIIAIAKCSSITL